MPPVREAYLGFNEQHGAVQHHVHHECQILDDGKSIAEVEPADAFPPES